jgi:hypothetical protein
MPDYFRTDWGLSSIVIYCFRDEKSIPWVTQAQAALFVTGYNGHGFRHRLLIDGGQRKVRGLGSSNCSRSATALLE